ncbi:single-strand binding protein family-domain-containing protein [Phlebopus sp. FC_14]|nr:single-strand binding protein family-domain-containing protein [Phlebopus sp. FC_14]
MLSAVRQAFSGAQRRAFSTTGSRSHNLSKLILIGRLARDPEVRTTKSEKEYVSYTVGTSNYPPPPRNPDGSRPDAAVTWHNIVSFNAPQNNYLMTLTKGSLVYVEANFELRGPQPDADPSTPAGQRQIFLRHESIRLIQARRPQTEAEE